MYKIHARKSFLKDSKKFKKNKPARVEIQKQVELVINDPTIGTAYEYDLSGLYKLRFGKKPSYRLIYSFYDCCKKETGCTHEPFIEESAEGCSGIIDFHFIKTRSDCVELYKKDRRFIELRLRSDEG